MKKILIVLLAHISLAFNQAAVAQSSVSIGIGGELSFPALEHFTRDVNMGTGFSVLFQYTLGEVFALTGMIGYIKWPPGDEDIVTEIREGVITRTVDRTREFSAIPIQIGMKGYFNSGFIRVYGIMLLGIHQLKIGAQPYSSDYIAPEEIQNRATLGLGLGFEIEFSKTIALDLSGRSQFVPGWIDEHDASNYVLRAGLLFGI